MALELTSCKMPKDCALLDEKNPIGNPPLRIDSDMARSQIDMLYNLKQKRKPWHLGAG